MATAHYLIRRDNMKTELIFPTLLIIIQIVAGIIYGIKSNFWLALYWIAASVVNFAVTYKP